MQHLIHEVVEFAEMITTRTVRNGTTTPAPVGMVSCPDSDASSTGTVPIV